MCDLSSMKGIIYHQSIITISNRFRYSTVLLHSVIFQL